MNETPGEESPAASTPSGARLSRSRLVLALLAIVLAVIAGVKLGRLLRDLRHRPAPRPQSPLAEADPIWSAWRAAKAGDVAAYLACFAGEAQAELEAELKRDGADALKQRLERQTSDVNGLMIEPLDSAKGGSPEFRAAVGRDNEIELFDYQIVRHGDVWKIATVTHRGRRPRPPSDGAEPTPPLHPGGPQ